MNEGKALVGKLCEFRRRDLVRWGTCTQFVDDSTLAYECDEDEWYDTAQAVTITPVLVEPEAPSHEVILNGWWRYGFEWYRVGGYYPDNNTYLVGALWMKLSWFATAERADIPPE